MAPRRFTDSRLFWAESAMIDWSQLAEANEYAPVEADKPAEDWTPQQVGLRWHLNAGKRTLPFMHRIGLPTGPFTVWRRDPSTIPEETEPIEFEAHGGQFEGQRLVTFTPTMATVTMRVSSTSGGFVVGLGNAPSPLSFLTWQQVPAGNDRMVTLRAGRLTGVLVPSNMTIHEVGGVRPQVFAGKDDWEPIEIVGYPVDQSWAGVGDHATDQGMVSALVSPFDAAVNRIQRGTPPFGWHAMVGGAVMAPPWEAVEPAGVIEEVWADLLPELKEALQLQQADQAGHRFTRHMPQPTNIDGQSLAGSGSDVEAPTVGILQMAVAGDPFLSLALGFGTNLPEPKVHGVEFDFRARYDYMVTAPYRDGVLSVFGFDGEFELAALALRPGPTFPPPVAFPLISEQQANLPPAITDGSFRVSTMTRWARQLDAAYIRSASHAVTRHDQGDVEAGLLLEHRPSRGHHPIAPAKAENDDQANLVHYADRHLPIPNNPGHRSLAYSVAGQNIFGIWSPWRSTPVTVTQPQLAPPRILAAELKVAAPPAGTVCPAELVVDLAWDWTDRRPSELRLLGRMFPSPDRATTTPNPLVPPSLATGLASAGPPVRLTFAGDVPTLVGAAAGSSLVALDPQGENAVTPGPQQGDEVRRYRLTIVGLNADFAATDHIGFALWASGVERLAPNRVVTSTSPVHTYASTPIAPPMDVEIVKLAGLPDSEGRSHANISWDPKPGAAAYIVYGSDETTMRTHYGMGEPPIDHTLSDRLTALLNEWVDEPDRRPFTRLITEPVTETSLDIALPRGTTGMATFVVIALNAGGIEGPWPAETDTDLRDRVIVRGIPRIAAPTTPELEARVDGANVALTIRTRPGHRVDRIDLHRVRVDAAARELDTMGPPVAEITATTPGWTVETGDDGTPLVFTGVDVPGASWRKVWYRAVAWADDAWPIDEPPGTYQIAERGLLVGRSKPSNPVSVRVPPDGPPNLSPISIRWPGGSAANVQLDWSSTVPFSAPLGKHRLEVDVREPGSTDALVTFSGPMVQVPTAAPTVGHGLWTDAGPGGGSAGAPADFHAIIRRDPDTALDAVVRVIDPLGRVNQRTLRVGPESVLPPPDLDNLQLITIIGRPPIFIFESSSPVERLAGQAYTLRVTALPKKSGPFDPRIVVRPTGPPPPVPPVRPGRLTPSRGLSGENVGPGELIGPGEVIDADLDASNLLIGPIGNRPLVLEVDLPDVVVDRGQPADKVPLQIRRARGRGLPHSYSVLADRAITRWSLLLISPDGRTASATLEV